MELQGFFSRVAQANAYLELMGTDQRVTLTTLDPKTQQIGHALWVTSPYDLWDTCRVYDMGEPSINWQAEQILAECECKYLGWKATQEEEARVRALKEAGLAKLTPDERKALGF